MTRCLHSRADRGLIFLLVISVPKAIVVSMVCVGRGSGRVDAARFDGSIPLFASQRYSSTAICQDHCIIPHGGRDEELFHIAPPTQFYAIH